MNKKGLIFLIILILCTSIPPIAFSSEYGKIATFIRPSGEALIKKAKYQTVMTSIFKNGTLIRQKETDISTYITFKKLTPGGYTVRYEGAGLETIEKKGIVVFPDQITEIKTYIKEGNAFHSHSYSTNFLPLDMTKQEINIRIKQLEEELRFLKNTQQLKK